MRQIHFPALRGLSLALGCGLFTAGSALAQTLDLSANQVAEAPAGPLSGLRLTNLLSTVKVGCTWVQGSDAETRNIGFPDTQAAYYIVSLPVNPAPGASYEVSGTYPQLRYFGFQTYDGYRLGNLIDSLPDARIATVSGLPALNANPAEIPVRGQYNRRYKIAIKFQDPPANDAEREPNTIYARAGTRKSALVKQLIYRTYLPNPGFDKKGGALLPKVVYRGADGEEIDLRNTPDKRACANLKRQTEGQTVFPVAGSGTGRPVFKPVSQTGSLILYPNADINYLRAQPRKSSGDMLLIRAKAPTTPSLPTEAPVLNPETRYWSLCQNELNSSAVVACLADRDMTLQEDGYLYAVISTPEKRHPKASPSFGYNWLPYGDAESAIVGFRQMLVRPDFVGDYGKAVAQPNRPVTETLGVWAPQITYCDLETFGASVNSGKSGGLTFAACKAAREARLLF